MIPWTPGASIRLRSATMTRLPGGKRTTTLLLGRQLLEVEPSSPELQPSISEPQSKHSSEQELITWYCVEYDRVMVFKPDSVVGIRKVHQFQHPIWRVFVASNHSRSSHSCCQDLWVAVHTRASAPTSPCKCGCRCNSLYQLSADPGSHS
jgi:hypothetical protein